nr:shugoshin-1 isoform X1 [Ipomoea batatas]
MESSATLDLETAGNAGEKPKVPEAAKTVIGNAARRKLVDISNVPQKMRPSNENEKLKHIPTEMKELIEKLETENKALMNALVERVKIIEMSGSEIQRLRSTLQKMQQQNHHLALSNTQKLMELNLCKDKLKVLEHELGCKSSLLKAMKLEAEVKPIKCEDTGDDLQEEEDKVDSELENAKRRRQSKSWRPSKHAQPHDNAAKKRLCVRRQSARLKHEQIKAEEDLYPIDDAKDSVHQQSNCDSIQENSSASACTSSDNGENNPASENEARESKRPSLSRPSRQAARKVQSYKEIPLNVKMRRSE